MCVCVCVCVRERVGVCGELTRENDTGEKGKTKKRENNTILCNLISHKNSVEYYYPGY